MSQGAPIGKLKRYLPGELLIREKEVSRRLFFIKSGRVSVFKTHMGQKVVLSTMGDGEIFGELSFIDASPRSASVEAQVITDVYIIEAEDLSAQIEKLPEWIVPIFKTVFARLRAADQRTLALRGLNGFERKHYGSDSVSQKIYREILRANRLLTLVYSHSLHTNTPLRLEDIPAVFEEILGDLAISVPLLVKILKDYGFMDREHLEKTKQVALNRKQLDAWIRDLQEEIDSGRYLCLTDSGIGLLKEVQQFLNNKPSMDMGSEIPVEILMADIGWSYVSYGDVAINELKTFNLIASHESGSFLVTPAVVQRALCTQTILRFFTPSART